MAFSPSGTSSVSSTMILQNSGSEEDLQVLILDQRKRKRMISNRESARRSRMKKQKHLDELAAQVAQLRNDNHQILTTMSHTMQRYLTLEAENSVLRTQVGELSHRLESLNDIIDFLNASNGVFEAVDFASRNFVDPAVNNFFNPLNVNYMNHYQPIMASAEAMLQY